MLTLNRLHGEDDPLRRGALLGRLTQSLSAEVLAGLVPEDAGRIRKLVDFTRAQRDRLCERLDAVDANNRAQALITLLHLEPAAPEEIGQDVEEGLLPS